MKKRLSVVIPVFNVEDIIKDCLKSIKWADEILCIDMGSNDKTMDICKSYDAVVRKNVPRNGNFDINRKIGLQIARGEWILKIDSDDRLTKKLQRAIKKVLQTSSSAYNGYKLFNKVFFFNKEIKHGIKNKKSHELRLFKRNKWQYKPFKFHELIKVKGKINFLQGEYLHFNSQSIKEFISKANLYTDLDSEKKYQSAQMGFLYTIISPIWKLFRLLIIQGGFLDGTHGLIVNTMYAIYNYIYKLKIWVKRRETQNYI